MENIRLDSERESPRDHPSVNRHGCTDDVGGLVRANEDAGVGNLFGSARAAFGPAIKLASAPRRAAANRIEFLLSTIPCNFMFVSSCRPVVLSFFCQLNLLFELLQNCPLSRRQAFFTPVLNLALPRLQPKFRANSRRPQLR